MFKTLHFNLFLATALTVATMTFILTACVPAHNSEEPPQNDPVIIAYVHNTVGDNWGPKGEVANKISHINYAFANVIGGKVVEGHEKDSANMARLQELKKVNPDLKILISVGGWTWSDNFSDAALTADSREIFAQSAIDFLQKHQLDGIDLDWEYPGQKGEDNIFRPEDKQNFTALLQLIREKLDSIAPDGQHYLLTIATGANQRYLDHTEMDKASAYLDYVNIMTYDYHGAWALFTGHHSNLYPSESDTTTIARSSSRAVEEHLQAGIPAEKLVLGVPFYGRWWSGVNPENKGLYQATEGEGGGHPFSRLEEEIINKNGFNR